MEVSNVPGYAADGGEPDTGFIRGKEKRVLGSLEGRPEPWFERGVIHKHHFLITFMEKVRKNNML